ncbi:MAG: hypothetical protein J6B10_02990 [Lachnospiraceae bacterium]|nr:hypothetical protein [Lachnospiraceae bacterium]
MGKMKTYEIGDSRLSKSKITGMRTGKGGILFLEKDVFCRRIFLPALVAEKKGHRWGRLHLEYELSEEAVCRVWAFAADEKEAVEACFEDAEASERKLLFEREGHLCGVNCQDMLLYELCGKYLWILIEVSGSSGGVLRNIRVEGIGDSFLNTFPEIYREEGGFLHRYLSVFSTLYQDFQREIDEVHKWLDLDTAPRQFLYQYAEWLGMELDGEFLEEELLRELVKNAYALNRIKGTREAVSRLVEMVLSKEAVIVERGLLQVKLEEEEKEVYNRLYGDSPQDVTVLVQCDGQEKEKARLLFLLKQFKPVRTRLSLVFLSEQSRMDSYCYMDRNAKLYQASEASIDRGAVMDSYYIR